MGVLSQVYVSGGELITRWMFQLEFLPTESSEIVGFRVEVECPGKMHNEPTEKF